jgi:tetratricopeptide (TPR) repeat protein
LINRNVRTEQAGELGADNPIGSRAGKVTRKQFLQSAAAYELQRQAINNQLRQLDAVSRLTVERMLKVTDQVIETNRALEVAQADIEQLQSEFWTVTDVHGRLSRQELLALLDAMVPLPADSAGGLVARGYARWRVGRPGEAESDFDTAAELKGSYMAVAVAAKGHLLIRNGKARDGQREFAKVQKVLKQDPHVAAIYAQALSSDARWSAAESAWKQLLQIGGHDAVAHRALALLYAAPPPERPAQPERSIQHARQACEFVVGDDWTCVHALALAHAATGDFAEAAVQARRAAELARGDKRDLCLEHARKFEAKERLVWNWRD